MLVQLDSAKATTAQKPDLYQDSSRARGALVTRSRHVTMINIGRDLELLVIYSSGAYCV